MSPGWRVIWRVKVAGPPRRTAWKARADCSRAAGHSNRRYRPWFTVCDALRVLRFAACVLAGVVAIEGVVW